MMMGVQDGVNLGDANLAEQVQHVPGAEIDQERVVPVLEHVNVAGVAQNVKVRGNLGQPAAGFKAHRRS